MVLKTYAFEELRKHNTGQDCWLLLHGKVYDVTNFLEQHPGGDDMLLLNTGCDATLNFEETQHSEMAREMMKDYQIGVIDPSTCPLTIIAKPYVKNSNFFTKAIQIIIPLLSLVLAIAGRFYSRKEAVPSV